MWCKSKEWFIKHLSGHYGQAWLGTFSFTESIFLPLPTDSFMMLVLLVKDNAKRWIYYATLTMLTSVLGAVVGYFLAFWIFDLFGPQLIHFYGLEEEFMKAQNFLDKSVFLFTFVGAVSPIPYKLFVLTAGFMKVNFFVFLLASIVGRSARLYLSAWLVHKYGKQSVIFIKKYTTHITVIAIAILAVYILGYMFM
jgi:membrane protein YqaA with SNARE-associated domain